jgi:hypothetical protein
VVQVQHGLGHIGPCGCGAVEDAEDLLGCVGNQGLMD